jgi:UDP-2,3-diacylglucosamine pyrophosphatase LpxH
MRNYRTIWISDLHLGTRGCKAEFLLDFLRDTEAETIYLVGDIIDGWRLKKSWYWPQAHNDVIQKILRKVRKGTRVIYVPGNHDEWLRDFAQLQFGGVEVVEDAIHVTADGRRLLVLHGDAFDAVVMHARWLALLGDGAYTATLWLNRHFNTVRRRLGYPYWSALVALGLSQAAGQECGAIYRFLWRCRGRRGAAPRSRRRRLRPHPSCRGAQNR